MKARHLFFALFMLCGCVLANAANTKTTVGQVSSSIVLTDDVDYIISGTTPFTTAGSVDIQNTGHAVVIISSIKPSLVISNWLSYVKINGETAVDGTNCQVKMYGKGTIIFPYGSGFSPLTCYTEPNFEGESCNTYSEGSSGGYMITLTAATLNNKIRSFRLKRGYMVTFALGTSGWGYSRCFIADTEDLEIASMPVNMDARVSSYRIHKWYDAHKAGIADNNDLNAISGVKASWCYRMWPDPQGINYLPDCEYVPHHYKENYPTYGSLGTMEFSCHIKGNNEPGNSADEAPCDVDAVLANWEDAMRTGKRLLSESSHDGSMNHLKAFIDSIDARGWRCDILDLHCYWNTGFSNLPWYSSNYGNGRPIWISEWIWGASWNNNGAFGSGVTDAQILSRTQEILEYLNASDIVERYAYWNSESKAHIYAGGVTTLGQYYADMDPGIGYNKSKDYVPTIVYKSPGGLSGSLNKTKGTFTLSWTDADGDMLDSMTVECKLPGTTKYTQIAKVTLRDKNSSSAQSYTYTDTPTESGAYYYRVCSYPMGDRTPKYSNETSVTISASFGNEDIQYGKLAVPNLDAVTTSFSESFSETPAVFMGICTNNNTALYPGNLITSAGKAKFSYQILPWAAQSTTTTSLSKMEEIPFLAMKAGNYKYGELDCEVGVVSIKDTAVVEFNHPFPEGVTPVVLVELRNPTLKTYPISLNVVEVTNTQFTAVCQYEAKIAETNTIRINLNMAYMALTPGCGTMISELLSSDTIKTDTLSTETFHLDNNIDSIAYTLQHTVRNIYSDVVIAAGTGENAMYGSSARQCTFVVNGDTLYFKNPKIFGKCQSSNYPGATALRLTRTTTVTDASSDNYGMTYSCMIKRQHDGTNSARTTSAFADELGFVVVDNGRDSETEALVPGYAYELVDTTPTHIQTASAGAPSTQIVAIYNLSGVRQSALRRGVNLVKYADGRFEKLLVK